VRLLIDSHALVWWRAGSSRLSRTGRSAIADPASEVIVSVAGLWELTIKISAGRLTVDADLETIIAEEGFLVRAIDFAHLHRLQSLPRIHRDPFDRMMIAQALAEGIPVVTGDRIFAAYGVQVVW
jgi:PIN domain nuclease of toxin-antitoxin system